MTDDHPDEPELTTEQTMLIRQGAARLREIRDDVRTRVDALVASLDLNLTTSDAGS